MRNVQYTAIKEGASTEHTLKSQIPTEPTDVPMGLPGHCTATVTQKMFPMFGTFDL